MIKKVTECVYVHRYTLINDKRNKRWMQNIYRKKCMFHLTKINYSFVQKNKNINKNIYNMNCVELYRYSCLLERENITNVTIYKQINKRVEMIYKFLNPSKIILLIKLYIQNTHLNIYQSTFHCLIEVAITKLCEFHIEEIVKLYNIISKVENNQNVVYLFKYVNNHLINNYTFIDVKSFSMILNAHAKLRIKDMKLINKFLQIIIQNNLPFDIVNYSIFFNAFYKLKLVNNDFVHTLVTQFLSEVHVWMKTENYSTQILGDAGEENNPLVHGDVDIQNSNRKSQLIDYSPSHICNILLYFTIQNINNIVKSNEGKEVKDETNLSDNIYIPFLLDLLIKKKNLLKCEEIIMLCQIFKVLKIKNDILVNHVEKQLLVYFNNVKEKKINHNSENKSNSPFNSIVITDNILVKILFDMCTFYNDINVYNHSIQYFLHRKIDFSTSILLLYIYSEINLLNYKMITLLIQIINKNYVQNFHVENVFLLIRSFYKICINSQYYFVDNKVADNVLNNPQIVSHVACYTKDSYMAENISPHSSEAAVHIPNGTTNTSEKNNSMVSKKLFQDSEKAPVHGQLSAPQTGSSSSIAPIHVENMFQKIQKLSHNIFSKLEKDLLNKKIQTNQHNIRFLCKILYYATVLRKFSFLNNVINLFTNMESEEIGDFKNILNILHSYCYVKNSNICAHKIEEMSYRTVQEEAIIELTNKDLVLTHYHLIVNKQNYNREIKNMIYFLFVQCKLNDYRYVNPDVIKSWLNCSFLNIHLLGMLLCTLMSKELNVITYFNSENARKTISKILHSNEDLYNEIKNSHIILKKDNIFKYTNLYNQILLHVDKLILKCDNIYDITRIFNSAFIFLSYFEKLKSEQKLSTENLQMQKCIYKTLSNIEKNVLQNTHLYNKEFIILLSAICIYNNNYSYLPFAFFFQYFDLYIFKNYLSYLILLSSDEEIKNMANVVFSLMNYEKKENKINNYGENIESFYSIHISRIIASVENAVKNCTNSETYCNQIINTQGELNSNELSEVSHYKGTEKISTLMNLSHFQIKQIINIYKLLINKNDFEGNEFFKKVKEKYLHSSEINHVLLSNQSLNELNELCLSMLKKKVSNIFLFKQILKRNYEHINSENMHLLKYEYIINLLNICINLKKYNFFINESVVINIVLNNLCKFNTLHKMNKLIESLLQLKTWNSHVNLTNDLQLNVKQIYLDYFLNNQIIDLNKVLYLLYLLYNFNKTDHFYVIFECFLGKFFQLKQIKVCQKRRYNFITSLNNTLFIAKNMYTLSSHDENGKFSQSQRNPFESMNKSNDEYVIHLNKEKASIMEYEIRNIIEERKRMIQEFSYTDKVENIKNMKHATCINDHSFVTLFLLLDLLKNDKKIEHYKIYNFCHTLFKDYIYLLNKEVTIQCLYIYFYSRINEEFTQEHITLQENRFLDDKIHYILNILITFIHNLDVYSILKLSFIYINIYIYSRKNYHVNENIKILFEQINKKKSLIEKNNILYEQVMRYGNVYIEE
ncbi:hypothetical protein, conserved [Plasmodium gonderi]|uniref:Uncharacterized protein n=1 Tax=Plasmodium gonderi TaxID=77519 RepID=A0A1Y1JJ86_PLAGO|nr:hypothetical protein, conserved [Plasmodium gonderi]GAW81257.1 hypothetical protein, conserved [Plasmodium gonderi]